MPIDPRLPASPGTPGGVAARLGDIERRLRQREGARVTIGQGAIQGSYIAAGAIDASHVTAQSFKAMWAQVDVLVGGVIQGGTIQAKDPAISTSNVLIDGNGVRGYNATGVNTFNLNANDGSVSATGVFIIVPGSDVPATTVSGAITANQWGGAIGGGNRVPNSSGEQGLDSAGVDRWSEGWDATGATLAKNTDSAGGNVYHGNNSFELTATSTGTFALRRGAAAAGDRIPIRGSRPHVVSCYAKRLVGTRNLRMVINYFTAAGVAVGTVVQGSNILTNGQSIFTANSSTTLSSSAWTRVVATLPAAPATAASMQIQFQSVTTGAVGDKLVLDALQVEEGDTLTAYTPKPDEVLYQQINAAHINVTSLSAINANLGTITAGSITLAAAGSFIRTSSADPTVRMDNTGYFITDSLGSKLVWMRAGSGTGALDIRFTPSQSFDPDKLIRWVQSDFSTVVSQLGTQAFTLAGSPAQEYSWTDLTTFTTQDLNAVAVTRVFASEGAFGPNTADVRASAGSSSSGVSASATTQGRQIIDNNGGSDFIQLYPNRLSARSTAKLYTITWPGGSQQAGTVNIETDLGMGTLHAVIATADQTNVGACYAFYDSGTKTVQVRTAAGTPAAGTTSKVAVIAWT